jgi:hypothetical protein
VLHLRCGDDILARLREAGLPGRAARWGDPLCEGPIRPWPDAAARRAERAEWLAARYGGAVDDHLATLAAEDAVLAEAAGEPEVVLWFEHDLFDQAILVHLLTRLAALAPDRTSLLCIGEHPDEPDFPGLGQLGAAQLAALFPARRPVTPEQFRLAQRAWAALGAEHPGSLEALVRDGTPELPFLADALRRWLAELPSVRNGLSQTESLALQAVAAGADRPRHAFEVVQRFEPRPWLGDRMFHARLRLLASGPRPLLTPAAGTLPAGTGVEFEQATLEVTEDGRAVLAGRADWCALARPNRRHGNLLLEGSAPRWRWDEAAERVVGR